RRGPARRRAARGRRGAPARSRADGLSLRQRVFRRAGALGRPVVAQHLRHAQAVVLEDGLAAGGLRAPVILLRAPLAHRLLVAPERERHDLARRAEALEALDGDEAVDAFEDRSQARRRIEIGLLALG